jgi:hypothetical protein
LFGVPGHPGTPASLSSQKTAAAQLPEPVVSCPDTSKEFAMKNRMAWALAQQNLLKSVPEWSHVVSKGVRRKVYWFSKLYRFNNNRFRF